MCGSDAVSKDDEPSSLSVILKEELLVQKSLHNEVVTTFKELSEAARASENNFRSVMKKLLRCCTLAGCKNLEQPKMARL